jgi:hypothetical protein
MHPLVAAAVDWGFTHEVAQSALAALAAQTGGTDVGHLTADAQQSAFLELCIALHSGVVTENGLAEPECGIDGSFHEHSGASQTRHPVVAYCIVCMNPELPASTAYAVDGATSLLRRSRKASTKSAYGQPQRK